MLRDKLKPHIFHKIGNGCKIYAWYDKWCPQGPLCNFITRKYIHDARLSDNATVNDIINNDVWLWLSKFPMLDSIQMPIVNDREDKAVWIANNEEFKPFIISNVWKDLKDNHLSVQWGNTIWFSQCNVKHTFILWTPIQRRLQTQDRMMVWNNNVDMKCSLCKRCCDSHDHLFFQCEFSKEVWTGMKKLCNGDNLANECDLIIQDLCLLPNSNSLVTFSKS